MADLGDLIEELGGIEPTIRALEKTEMYNTREHPHHAEAVATMRTLLLMQEEEE